MSDIEAVSRELAEAKSAFDAAQLWNANAPLTAEDRVAVNISYANIKARFLRASAAYDAEIHRMARHSNVSDKGVAEDKP